MSCFEVKSKLNGKTPVEFSFDDECFIRFIFLSSFFLEGWSTRLKLSSSRKEEDSIVD